METAFCAATGRCGLNALGCNGRREDEVNAFTYMIDDGLRQGGQTPSKEA